MLRGILALVILYIVPTVDILVAVKRHELSLPHIPGEVLVGGAIFSFIFLFAGIVSISFALNNKENKALFVFSLGSGAIDSILGAGLIILLSIQYIEFALFVITLLSLFSVGKLLDC